MTFLQWLREEWRLMRLHTWGEEYDAPRLQVMPDDERFTAADPRCARTLQRLADARATMIATRMGTLDTGKKVTNASSTDIEQTFNAVRRVSGGTLRKVK